MAKKSAHALEFFQNLYGPVERKLKDRAVDEGKTRLRLARRERQRRWRAKNGPPKLTPEALSAVRRENVKHANAARMAMSPEERVIMGARAGFVARSKITPEERKQRTKDGREKMRAYNASVSSDTLRDNQRKAVYSRLKITPDWPFRPPRFTVRMKARMALGLPAIIDPKYHNEFRAIHPLKKKKP